VADPQVVKAASGLTIGKQSTSLQHCSSTSHKDGLRLQRQARQQTLQLPLVSPLSSQTSHMAGLIDSTWDDPVGHQRSILERRMNCFTQAPFQPLKIPQEMKMLLGMKSVIRERWVNSSLPPFNLVTPIEAPSPLRRPRDNHTSVQIAY
jgi:hypothetical protein